MELTVSNISNLETSKVVWRCFKLMGILHQNPHSTLYRKQQEPFNETPNFLKTRGFNGPMFWQTPQTLSRTLDMIHHKNKDTYPPYPTLEKGWNRKIIFKTLVSWRVPMLIEQNSHGNHWKFAGQDWWVLPQTTSPRSTQTERVLGPCLGEGEHPETQQGDSIGCSQRKHTSQADLVEVIFFSSMQHLQDESVLLHGGFLKWWKPSISHPKCWSFLSRSLPNGCWGNP